MNAHQQWIEHKGGERPAAATGQVDVRFRDGSEADGDADEWGWLQNGYGDDIVAWRPHVAAQPAPQPATEPAPCGQRDNCARFPFCGCGTEPEPLPERDPSKTNEEQGLYRKYEVHRVDGADKPGGRHHGCELFVLDLTHDERARVALAAYAHAAAATHPELASDLIERHGLAASLRSDAMTMAMRLYAESDDTFAPETREVMARWRPLVDAEFARIAAEWAAV